MSTHHYTVKLFVDPETETACLGLCAGENVTACIVPVEGFEVHKNDIVKIYNQCSLHVTMGFKTNNETCDLVSPDTADIGTGINNVAEFAISPDKHGECEYHLNKKDHLFPTGCQTPVHGVPKMIVRSG